jgi:hypothetical protein
MDDKILKKINAATSAMEALARIVEDERHALDDDDFEKIQAFIQHKTEDVLSRLKHASQFKGVNNFSSFDVKKVQPFKKEVAKVSIRYITDVVEQTPSSSEGRLVGRKQPKPSQVKTVKPKKQTTTDEIDFLDEE